MDTILCCLLFPLANKHSDRILQPTRYCFQADIYAYFQCQLIFNRIHTVRDSEGDPILALLSTNENKKCILFSQGRQYFLFIQTHTTYTSSRDREMFEDLLLKRGKVSSLFDSSSCHPSFSPSPLHRG